MPIPQTVLDLIQRFEDNENAYRAAQYNEAQVREEFITPFFAALGWDVYNRQGASEKYKAVVHEAAVRVGGATKAPDYAFRLGGQRVFFVEAKKPAVALKDDPAPAYQLRRYAWSAKLPLSILTDFEEFAVYDCRDKPAQSDTAATGRIFYCTYRDYPEQWDYLVNIFAPEAITKGAFDRFAETARGKRGTAEVDAAFLAEIEGWRDVLARNIALRNPGLSARDLNYAVQQTIDRLIFLRIAEDRGIEPYQRLLDAAQGAGIYPRLVELFRQADNRYNSGLFYFEPEKDREETPDTFTLDLTLDDKVLKGILHSLYYPASPYQFDMLPADILGQVYEQFLGRVIRLTPAGYAKVEEKPEVKKAGGVYYTPTYIVDYIVEHTVGALLAGKTPAQVKGSARVAPLRVLDPACGSGTFLIQAYQYLLDWYLEQYTQKDPCPGKAIQPDPGGGWRLTSEERKAILLRHIYGVDIDPQAVEVTKLSLLLKVLEGETEGTLGAQLAMSLAGQDRVLPDLSRNIRCGNSLIGPDYYQGQQLSLGIVDEETLYRINAFDWDQGFHSALMAGGFDAVIGNPPWISLSGKHGVDIYPKEEVDYLIRRFHGNSYMPNMYEYFIAQGLNLTKQGGIFSFIVPDRLGFNEQFIELRRRILSESRIIALLYKVPFPGIVADTLIFTFKKEKASIDHTIEIKEYETSGITIKQADLLNEPTLQFKYFESDRVYRIIQKIRSSGVSISLIRVCKSTSGFGGKSTLITESQETEVQIPILRGRSIERYAIRQKYWFEFKRENLTGRTTDKVKLGASSKILLRKTGDRIIATYDDSGIFPEQSLYFLYDNQDQVSFKYLLGILNSRLLTFYYRTVSLTNKNSIAQVKKVDLDQLPIRTLNFADPADVARHDRMVALVEQMLDLHRRLPDAKTPQATRLLQQQIDLTDEAIDALVYELYGLTAEEIAIVEGG